MVFSQRAQGQRSEIPLVITSSDTPHPHQPEPKVHPRTRARPHRRLMPVDWGYQSVIAAARSRDRDPLT
jgi:hypothetical protein